jgi:hypothetical protein
VSNLKSASAFKSLSSPPRKRGSLGQPPQCLGSLGSAFAKHEFNQLIWFIFLGLHRKCYSSRVKSERSVKKLDTPPRNDVSERFRVTGPRRGHQHQASPTSRESECPAIEEGSRPLPGQLIRVQLRFNSCISFSASALSVNEPTEPSRFSSMKRASAARPTRYSATARWYWISKS